MSHQMNVWVSSSSFIVAHPKFFRQGIIEIITHPAQPRVQTGCPWLDNRFHRKQSGHRFLPLGNYNFVASNHLRQKFQKVCLNIEHINSCTVHFDFISFLTLLYRINRLAAIDLHEKFNETRVAVPTQYPITNTHPPLSYDFANILFAGPCNARCPFCIGQRVDPRLNAPNLRQFPPTNLDKFVEMIRHFAIRQIVFTGTTTDPQRYRHEARLLDFLRGELHPESQFSLHTNGRLALRRMDIFNSYDRVCLSFPSFAEATYRRVMGVPGVPDLAEILRRSRVQVKVSCVVTEANRGEIPDFLRRCQAIGIERLVLRKLYGELRGWEELLDSEATKLVCRGNYRGNPVYDLGGMEVTLWDFDVTASRSINLFADGTISSAYRLVEAG